MSTFKFQPIIAGPSVEPLDGSDVAGNSIRSVSSSTPVTTGWNVGDIWIDTLNGATANVLRYWSGTAFVPARSSAIPLLVDLFTGSNGDSLTNWITGTDPSTGTGGGATIQDNTARFRTSTTNGYAPAGRISRRANITNPTDANMSFSFKFNTSEPDVRIWMRADNGMTVDHGYFVGIRKGNWSVAKSVAFVATDLTPADIDYGFSEGILYSCRFRVVGTTVQAKVWVAADAEPGSWGYSGTDSSITAAGAVGFECLNANATAINADFFVDNVTIEAT